MKHDLIKMETVWNDNWDWRFSNQRVKVKCVVSSFNGSKDAFIVVYPSLLMCETSISVLSNSDVVHHVMCLMWRGV